MTAIAVEADDIDRLRRAVAQARAVGGDLGWLGDMLAARLESLPAARIGRRNDALIDLVGTFPTKAAASAAVELRRYAGSAWKRDRNLASPPAAYLTQPRRLAAFRFMKENDGVALSEKQIRRILKTNSSGSLGHWHLVSMSYDICDSSRHQIEAEMTAVTKITDQTFLDALRRAPFAQSILADNSAREIAERKALVDALAKLDAKAPTEFAKLDKAISAEIANVRAAEIALKAANDKLAAANYAKSGATIAYDNERLRLEAALRNSPAADVIDVFTRDMRDELESARKAHEGGWIQERHPVTREPMLRGYTNKESVAARVNAIHAALAAAEALRLAADQSNIEAKLAALRAGLPKIGPAKHALVAA